MPSPGLPRQTGFTLVEMVIVLVIFGILAAFAFPNYQRYTQRTHRAAVLAEVGDLAQQLQQSKSKSATGEYDNTINASGLGGKFYTVAVAYTTTSGRTTGYTITATAKAGTPQDKDTANGTSCTTLRYNHLGQQTPGDCWPS